MEVTAKALEEFKKIHKEVSGKDLTDGEARPMAERVLRAIELTYQPIPKEAWKKFKEEHLDVTKEEIEKIEGIQ